MKRFLVPFVVLSALFVSGSMLASLGRKAISQPEEFLFADSPAGEFAYQFISPGQTREEAYAVTRSFRNPYSGEKITQQRIQGIIPSEAGDMLMWKSEGRIRPDDGSQEIGMLNITFVGNRVVDVFYYSARGEKNGKVLHKSSPNVYTNLNGD